MTDDWSEPTGEHEPFADTPTREYFTDDRDPLVRVVDLDGVSEHDIRIVDAFFQELALEASEDPAAASAEEQQEVDAIAAFVARLTSTAGG